MKTAFSSSKLFRLSLLTGVCLAAACAPAFAATQYEAGSAPIPSAAPATTPPMPPAMPSAPAAPMPPQLPMATGAPAMPIVTATPPVKEPPMPADIKLPKDEKETAKGLDASEEKVTDSIKEVMKRLEATKDNMTLDDLNSAAQAIAKIKALIDIEKNLAEYEKIKQERESKSFISAIPASALGGTGSGGVPRFQGGAPDMGSMGMVMPPPQFMTQSISSIEVSRIVGGAGRYTALIKTPDGQTKTMQVGDRLTDGSKITSISAAGVEFGEGSSTRLVRVKDVDTVFSGGIP